MFLTVLESSNEFLEFPVVLEGIPDKISTMLMQCVLKISVSFKLSLMSFPLFSMVIFSLLKKPLFIRKGLTVFQNDLLFTKPRLVICSK